MTTSFTDGTNVFVPIACSPFSSSSSSQNIFHVVVGSPDADVTLMEAALPSGNLVAAFSSQPDAVGFRDMLRQASTFQVSSDDDSELNFTLVINGTIVLAIDPTSLSFWTVAFDFQEVPA